MNMTEPMPASKNALAAMATTSSMSVWPWGRALVGKFGRML
jgi:hypothetical protein